MTEAIAYFLTWSTYGTWLPGDARGWVDYGQGWQLPDPILELECAARMSQSSCRLNRPQRDAVERQIDETCLLRGWNLLAVNCRSNHIHVVVAAGGVRPRQVRIDLKAWTTRRLRRDFDPQRKNWWAERGSLRHIHDERSLGAAVTYTLDAQDRQIREVVATSKHPVATTEAVGRARR